MVTQIIQGREGTWGQAIGKFSLCSFLLVIEGIVWETWFSEFTAKVSRKPVPGHCQLYQAVSNNLSIHSPYNIPLYPCPLFPGSWWPLLFQPLCLVASCLFCSHGNHGLDMPLVTKFQPGLVGFLGSYSNLTYLFHLMRCLFVTPFSLPSFSE